MSTANISEDIRVKFPLHSAVWENDYRKLEEQIRLPQVGKTLRRHFTKQYSLARRSQEGDVKSL